MEQSRVTQTPTEEDFIDRLDDCSVWSEMGLRSGYHQLALSSESRDFRDPMWQLPTKKKLVFGASQDLFDVVMQQIFGDISSCLNQSSVLADGIGGGEI